MEDLNEVFIGETIKASDLQGHEPVVTIATIEPIEFQQNGKTDRKLKMTFVGKQKAFICNVTNARRIGMMHGSKFRTWVGKKIQLYSDIVDFKGEPKEAIRVRPVKSANGPAQQRAAPEVPFDDAVADIGETF